MHKRILRALLVGALTWAAGSAFAAPGDAPSLTYQALPKDQRAAIDELEHRTFQWFWDSADPTTGLVPDHWPADSFASIASVGFALTAYGVGVERGYVTREQAVDRTLATLRFFNEATQDDSEDGATGYHGFFYHFLDMKTGKRYARGVELSSVDTTLLLGGVLFAQTYFDRSSAKEKQIRALADTIYRRVDWTWMQPKAPLISMGWTPGGQFIPSNWKGYDEGMLVYVLALGSPTHPVSDDAWQAWTSTYPKQWGEFQGRTFLNFAPLFGHQYSHTWVDFRGIQDAWSREHQTDYFQNSRQATYAQRSYAIANPNHWEGYGENIWGLTACNGPGDAVVKRDDGSTRAFYGYTARGAGLDYVSDDGTIAPTAAGGSIAFAPEIVVPALLEMKKRYGDAIYGKYGFVDAFNPSYDTGTVPKEGRLVKGMGWADDKQIGIDQGPIVLMIENWRSGFVWNVMRKNPYMRKGLERAGFSGGWLDEKPR
jgi:hypothetical protein